MLAKQPTGNTQVAAPPQPTPFGVSAPPAQTPAPADDAKKQLAAKFSFEKILEKSSTHPGFRTVAKTEISNFEKVKLGHMIKLGQDLRIKMAEIDPLTKIASEVAEELRENPVRCLHCVLLAHKSASQGDDAEWVKEQAVRIYFEQQEQILGLICRLVHKRELIDYFGADGCPQDHLDHIQNALFVGQVCVCVCVYVYHTYVCVYVCMYVYVQYVQYVCIYVSMYMYIYACVCVCSCVFVCVYVHTHTHTHTHTRTHLGHPAIAAMASAICQTAAFDPQHISNTLATH